MRINKIIAAGTAAFLSAFSISADDNGEAPKYKVAPSAHIQADGALFVPDGDGFADGVSIPDLRLGVKASYGKISTSINLGYRFGKITLKDAFLQYDFNDRSFIRGGYFIHQFGLNNAYSNIAKSSFEAPLTQNFFGGTARNLGAMYEYHHKQWYAVASVVFDSSLTTPANELGKISVGALARLVWAPLHDDGNVAQVGVSGWAQSASHVPLVDDDGHTTSSEGFFTFTTYYPTLVDRVKILDSDVRKAKSVFKLTPELLLSKGRVALESQYYFMNVSRKEDLQPYQAQGVYGLLRCLVLGDREYRYAPAVAGLAAPGKKTLEAVVGYNFTYAACAKAGINGGITNDYSLTMNYYFNKYLLARLRYSYTTVHGSPVRPDGHESIIQARIQFSF